MSHEACYGTSDLFHLPLLSSSRFLFESDAGHILAPRRWLPPQPGRTSPPLPPSPRLPAFSCSEMDILYQCKEVLKIQKFRRMVSYAGFYCFTALITYAYTSNTTRAGISRADQYYASYPAGTELLTDTAKLYKAALGNCFEIDEWGPIEFSIMAKHFDRQGKPPYAYHAQYLAHLLSHGQLDGSG